MRRTNSLQKAFTLVELLVVISIIGILIGLSIFGLQGARESARDGRRKADLQEIRSGLEIFKSDCDHYPSGSSVDGGDGQLSGDDTTTTCASSNVYISQVPVDPVDGEDYVYTSDGATYTLCADLEQDSDTGCDYSVTNP